MKIHTFINYCINFEELLTEPTLKGMLKIAKKQSITEEAKKKVDLANYKDYNQNESCPAYIGLFGEWLCWHFLNHYGHLWKVAEIEMTDSIDNAVADYGIDGTGVTTYDQLLKTTHRKATKGSPVYIQVKTTFNSAKEYSPNDGSRIPNFGLNALSNALLAGKSYQARYILFTTGKGLHYTLEKMSNGIIEVINYKTIHKLMDNDVVFLNRLRNSVGISEIPFSDSECDPEFRMIQQEIVDNVE
jgi:hypothetical protein